MAACPSIRSCVLAFCAAVLAGRETETGEEFVALRAEVQAFLDAPWPTQPPDAAERAVVEYMLVPSHVLACVDLDFQHLSRSDPLRLTSGTSHVLHLHQIMEAFSRTSPQRYAAVWVPLLDLALVCSPPGSTQLPGLERARLHVQEQSAAPPPPLPHEQLFAGVDPNSALDGIMHNILSSFPGLQGMVQQLLSAGAPGDAGALPAVMGQVRELLGPLLTEAVGNDPAGPQLQPAVSQILQGFSGLTEALSQGAAGAPPGAPPPPAVPHITSMEEEE